MEQHNHMTRDIKPEGQCPACDRYHASQKMNATVEEARQEERTGWAQAEGITPSRPVELVFAGANLGGESVYVCGKEAGEYGCGALVPESRIQQHRDWHTAYDIEFE